MIIISSDVTTVSLNVSYSSQEGADLFVGRGTSINGTDYFFKYGQKKTFRYDTILTTFSDAQLINEWWENNKNLTLIDTFTDSTAVQLSSSRIPFTGFQGQPYQSLYNQSLEFTEK